MAWQNIWVFLSEFGGRPRVVGPFANCSGLFHTWEAPQPYQIRPISATKRLKRLPEAAPLLWVQQQPQPPGQWLLPRAGSSVHPRQVSRNHLAMVGAQATRACVGLHAQVAARAEVAPGEKVVGIDLGTTNSAVAAMEVCSSDVALLAWNAFGLVLAACMGYAKDLTQTLTGRRPYSHPQRRGCSNHTQRGGLLQERRAAGGADRKAPGAAHVE